MPGGRKRVVPARPPPGAISFWNAEERKLEEDSKIHRNTISSIVWTASGDRLITGDENGRASTVPG